MLTSAGVKRSEQAIRSPAGEQDVPARDQKWRPEERLEIVLPNSLAGVQVPGLKFSQVIGGACAGTDRSENAVDVVPHIKALGLKFWHLTSWEVRADVVVRRDVEEFRLRAPRLGGPVFAATNARAALGALVRPRSLGLIDRGTTGLRVNRCKDVVIGEREGVQELQAIAIQDPKVAVATRVRGRLREFPVDLCVDQERRRDFIPVPAIVRSVLVIALELAGVSVESKRRVRVEIVAGPVVGDLRPRIPRTPVARV